jgi:stage III sporulation protein AF
MMDLIANLIKYIVVLIFLASLLEMLLPQGEFRRYLRMLVGILLILTLLTPLQKIMSIEPYLELPALFVGEAEEGDLSAILNEGKKMQSSSFSAALGAYRSRIHQVLASMLLDHFGQELLKLDLEMEEDPGRSEFGSLRSISAVTRASKVPGETETMAKREGISISVNVFGEEGGYPDETGQEVETADARDQVKAENIQSYLADYLQLSSDNVEIKIIP